VTPFWRSFFGNERPVEIEIGPGTGTFLIHTAHTRPEVNFLGIERSASRARSLNALVASHRLQNVRIIAADAVCLIENVVPPASVAAYHVYFPDPWWKRRHHRRRLFTPPFARSLARTLIAGGVLHVATDVEAVFGLILLSVGATADLHRDPHRCSPRREVTTFERKGLRRGAPIHKATFVKLEVGEPIYVSSAAPITPAESPS
jgi:tRNA (guanine-N7-)-methyltransferase